MLPSVNKRSSVSNHSHIHRDSVQSATIGGNQRELARQKNQKKLEKQKSSSKDKGENRGKKLDDRRHRDAEVMRLKQQKANEKKNEPSAGASK
ncbi:hypothetical protein BSL78_11212 [Apostichopus japonicus]|uniref:Small EDRK-rich factor-like N-terminal domain-containing protein n=1 Tax=Stichopus japonicus TaxID=307972 RepID=A0A2G8KV74_STIJA|nr:hypothetical protein BSL78_11212 [Apostichopus japonicus]